MRWHLGTVSLALALVVSHPAQAAPPPGSHPASSAVDHDKRPAKIKPAKLAVSTRKARPGQPVLVTVTGAEQRPTGSGGKVGLVFFPVRRGWQALFTVPLQETPPEIAVSVDAGPGGPLAATVAVTPTTFQEEKVTIAPELAEPGADKRKLIDADNAAVLEAFKSEGPPLWTSAFKRPSSGAMTSPYGSWRTFNDDYRSRHLGLDIGARKGQPVRAIQAGKVTLVRDGFLMGGTVVIAHGAGIASAYFHVSDPTVAVGDQVKRGAVIGKVGLTGRTTGPHIHVGVWLPGGFADPAAFFKLAIAPPRVEKTAAAGRGK